MGDAVSVPFILSCLNTLREVITSCDHGSKIPGSSQTVVLQIWQKKKRKMVAHTFLPSFENANGRLGQERLFEIQKFCYYDNSPLLESKMAIK